MKIDGQVTEITTVKNLQSAEHIDPDVRHRVVNHEIDGLGLRSDSGVPPAKVKETVRHRLSGAARYGTAEWDVIPYAVEVHSTVELVCDQDPSVIENAQVIASGLALSSAEERMEAALVRHLMNIQEKLFKERFNSD